MAVSDALAFIRFLREHRDQIALSPETTTLDDLRQAGAQHGYNFTIAELRTAFKQDWGLRWLARHASQT